MLPDPEITASLMTVSDTADLAAEGQLADVYAAQVAGLRRAEEVLEASEPWTEELVRRDQLAIDNYVISYGVSME